MQPHDLEGLLTAVAQDFTSPKTQHSVNLAQPEFLIIGCRRKKVKSLLKVKIKIPNAYYKLPPPPTRNYLLTHACTVSNISQEEQVMCEVKCLCVGLIDYSCGHLVAPLYLYQISPDQKKITIYVQEIIYLAKDEPFFSKRISVTLFFVEVFKNFLLSLRQQYMNINTMFTL